MVRLSDLHEAEARHMRARADAMRPVPAADWVTPEPLADATVAIISTAGLHRRDDAPFNLGAIDYRLLPGDVDFADVVVFQEQSQRCYFSFSTGFRISASQSRSSVGLKD